MFKGYKTFLFNLATTVIALSQVTGFVQLIPAIYMPHFLLIVAIANIVLRWTTTTGIFKGIDKPSE